MAKRVPKASKRRLIFLTPFIIGITVYFLCTIIFYGYNLIALTNKQHKLSNDLNNLRIEEDYLKNEIQKLKNPDYLARYARKNFLYSKDGEYVIKLNDNHVEKETNVGFIQLLQDNYIYIAVTFSLLVLIFIIMIFKRNRTKNKKRD